MDTRSASDIKITQLLQRPIFQPSTRQRFMHYGSAYGHPSTYWELQGPKFLTWGTVGICVAVYGYYEYARKQCKDTRDLRHVNFIEKNLVTSRENLRQGRYWTLITASFTHFTPLHLGFNMFALTSFGPTFIKIFGPGAFVGVWVGAAVTCSLAGVWWETFQEQERRKGKNQQRKILGHPIVSIDETGGRIFARHIGSSGSILGLITAQGCWSPYMGISMLMLPISVPFWGASLGFVAFSFYAMSSGAVPYIGHAGHLGGMAFGAVSYFVWLKRKFRISRYR